MEEHIPIKTVSNVLVLFLIIWYTSVSKTIIDTEIYDNTFDYVVEHVLYICMNIDQKRSPDACATEASAANSSNQEHHKDDYAQ